jgi:hypothetical protein
LQKVPDPILKNEVCSELFFNSKFLGSSKRLHSSPFLKMESSGFDDNNSKNIEGYIEINEDKMAIIPFLKSVKEYFSNKITLEYNGKIYDLSTENIPNLKGYGKIIIVNKPGFPKRHRGDYPTFLCFSIEKPLISME